MYRKSSGQLGFNPLNMFSDFPGSLSSSSGADPGHISSVQKDSIYLYQLQFANPCALTAGTLYVSKIIDHESVAHKVFQQLQKLNLVTAEGDVNTAGFDSPTFGKQYTHSLSMIPVSRQKHLVDLLFWWDDEARRLKKLLAERTDLMAQKNIVTDAAQGDRLQLLLSRIQMKIGARPSERNARMEQDEDLADVEAATAGTAVEGNRSENPPAYQ